MKESNIPLASIILVTIGVILNILSIFDVVDSLIGMCGLILGMVGVGIRLRTIAQSKQS